MSLDILAPIPSGRNADDMGNPPTRLQLPTPHCGACMAQMPDAETLALHLETCHAAACLLPVFTALMTRPNCDPRHKAAHLCRVAVESAPHIKEYAAAIADEMPSFMRSQVHQRLCARLGVPYAEFKPFESDDILDLPNADQCERLIYEEILKHAAKAIGVTPAMLKLLTQPGFPL